MAEKKCSKCGRVLPLDSFPKNRTRKDGHHVYCQECYNEMQREYWQRRKERKKQEATPPHFTPKEWESDYVKQAIEKTNKIWEENEIKSLQKEKTLDDFSPRDIIKHLYKLGYRIEDNKLVCYVKQQVNVKDIINN